MRARQTKQAAMRRLPTLLVEVGPEVGLVTQSPSPLVLRAFSQD